MAPSFRTFFKWLASYSLTTPGNNAGKADNTSLSPGPPPLTAMSFRSHLLDDLGDVAREDEMYPGHLFWPTHPFLRRLVRQAVAAASPLTTSVPSFDGSAEDNETMVANSTDLSETPEGAAPPHVPAGPKGPNFAHKALEKAKEFAETAKTGIETGMEIAADKTKVIVEKTKTGMAELPENPLVVAAADKSKIPIWGVLLMAASSVTLSIVGLFFLIRWRWRSFQETEKGQEMVQKMKDNRLLCKFVAAPEEEKEPEPDEAGLTANEEAPGEEVPEGEGGEGEGEEPEGRKDDTLGRISYKLEYDFGLNNFLVHIIKIDDLYPMDSCGTSDAYVKIFFPGDKKKFETKVHRKTVNPQYNETFTYKGMPFMDLMAGVLFIQVFDYDRFSSHDQIGEIRIQMCQIELTTPFEATQELDPPVDADNEPLGEICFSLRYVPTTGKLTLCIIECKNLKKMDLGGLADPFVKINLFEKGKKFQKKKTSVKQNTLNPYFNEAFTFDIPETQMKKYHFVLTALDYDLIGACTPIGRAAVGPKWKDYKGRAHWQEMIDNPRRPIAQWHTLEKPDEPKFAPTPPETKKKKKKKK